MALLVEAVQLLLFDLPGAAANTPGHVVFAVEEPQAFVVARHIPLLQNIVNAALHAKRRHFLHDLVRQQPFFDFRAADDLPYATAVATFENPVVAVAGIFELAQHTLDALGVQLYEEFQQAGLKNLVVHDQFGGVDSYSELGAGGSHRI